MAGEIWLDVSRMLWRVRRGALTGIDRVEISYAEHLVDMVPERLRFVAFNYWRGSFGFLPSARMADMVRQVSRCWREGTLCELHGDALSLFLRSMVAMPVGRPRDGGIRPTYLNVSTHPLNFVGSVGRMLRRTGAAFVPLIHDLIPLEHPEYVPVVWTKRHRDRMQTVAKYADGVIANSGATKVSLAPYVSADLPVLVAPLGVSPAALVQHPPYAELSGHPYFVCLGTIEPRKNHITLLHVWRRLAEELGSAAPHLFVVGRRGWENEHIIDMLERCEAIRPIVHETGILPDADVASLMAGARGLLMPSFTEGYGLPVAEALARRVPVICSDIPAHREIGGQVPEYIDPLDAVSWLRAAKDYACESSARRAAQIQRLSSWRIPTWESHVSSAIGFIDANAAWRAHGVAPAGKPVRIMEPIGASARLT